MKIISRHLRAVLLLAALTGISCLSPTAFAQPTPAQVGTYVGTAKGSYYDFAGKKITNTQQVTMVINPDSSVNIWLGSELYTCTYANFTPVSVGYYNGLTNGYAFTGVFTTKNGSAKGPYHFVSPYGGTFGKMNMKKSVM